MAQAAGNAAWHRLTPNNSRSAASQHNSMVHTLMGLPHRPTLTPPHPPTHLHTYNTQPSGCPLPAVVHDQPTPAAHTLLLRRQPRPWQQGAIHHNRLASDQGARDDHGRSSMTVAGRGRGGAATARNRRRTGPSRRLQDATALAAQEACACPWQPL